MLNILDEKLFPPVIILLFFNFIKETIVPELQFGISFIILYLSFISVNLKFIFKMLFNFSFSKFTFFFISSILIKESVS